MLTLPPILLIPSSLVPGHNYAIALENATMTEAIEWMNAPRNVLDRIERKYALITYINTRIELAAIKETVKSPEISPKG